MGCSQPNTKTARYNDSSKGRADTHVRREKRLKARSPLGTKFQGSTYRLKWQIFLWHSNSMFIVTRRMIGVEWADVSAISTIGPVIIHTQAKKVCHLRLDLLLPESGRLKLTCPSKVGQDLFGKMSLIHRDPKCSNCGSCLLSQRWFCISSARNWRESVTRKSCLYKSYRSAQRRSCSVFSSMETHTMTLQPRILLLELSFYTCVRALWLGLKPKYCVCVCVCVCYNIENVNEQHQGEAESQSIKGERKHPWLKSCWNVCVTAQRM